MPVVFTVLTFVCSKEEAIARKAVNFGGECRYDFQDFILRLLGLYVLNIC